MVSKSYIRTAALLVLAGFADCSILQGLEASNRHENVGRSQLERGHSQRSMPRCRKNVKSSATVSSQSLSDYFSTTTTIQLTSTYVNTPTSSVSTQNTYTSGSAEQSSDTSFTSDVPSSTIFTTTTYSSSRDNVPTTSSTHITSTSSSSLGSGTTTNGAATTPSSTTESSSDTTQTTTSTTATFTATASSTSGSAAQPSIGQPFSIQINVQMPVVRRAGTSIGFSGKEAIVVTDPTQAFAFAISSAGELIRYTDGLPVGVSQVTAGEAVRYFAPGDTGLSTQTGWSITDTGLTYPGAQFCVDSNNILRMIGEFAPADCLLAIMQPDTNAESFNVNLGSVTTTSVSTLTNSQELTATSPVSSSSLTTAESTTQVSTTTSSDNSSSSSTESVAMSTSTTTGVTTTQSDTTSLENSPTTVSTSEASTSIPHSSETTNSDITSIHESTSTELPTTSTSTSTTTASTTINSPICRVEGSVARPQVSPYNTGGVPDAATCLQLCQQRFGCEFVMVYRGTYCEMYDIALSEAGWSASSGSQELYWEKDCPLSTTSADVSSTTSASASFTQSMTISSTISSTSSSTSTTSTTTTTLVFYIVATDTSPAPQPTGPCHDAEQYATIYTISNGDRYGLCHGDCRNAGDLVDGAFVLDSASDDASCTLACSQHSNCVAGSVATFSAGSGPGICNGLACRMCYLKSTLGRQQNCGSTFDTFYKIVSDQSGASTTPGVESTMTSSSTSQNEPPTTTSVMTDSSGTSSFPATSLPETSTTTWTASSTVTSDPVSCTSASDTSSGMSYRQFYSGAGRVMWVGPFNNDPNHRPISQAYQESDYWTPCRIINDCASFAARQSYRTFELGKTESGEWSCIAFIGATNNPDYFIAPQPLYIEAYGFVDSTYMADIGPIIPTACTNTGDLVKNLVGGTFQNFYSGSGAGIPRSVYDDGSHPGGATWYDPAQWNICAAIQGCAYVAETSNFNSFQFYMDNNSNGRWTCLLMSPLLQDPSQFQPDSTRQEVYGFYHVAGQSTTTTTLTTLSTLTTSGSTPSTMTTTEPATTTTTTTPLSIPTLIACGPVVDGSFESVPSDMIDAQNFDGTPFNVGAWTVVGGFSSVTNNGPTYAADGTQNGVVGADSPGLTALYQDLSHVEGVYQLSYWYWVQGIYSNGLYCTFSLKLNDAKIDTFEVVPATVVPESDAPYNVRSVPSTPQLSGSARLSFELECPSGYAGNTIFFVDKINMEPQGGAQPGVNCGADALSTTDSLPSTSTTGLITTTTILPTSATFPTEPSATSVSPTTTTAATSTLCSPQWRSTYILEDRDFETVQQYPRWVLSTDTDPYLGSPEVIDNSVSTPAHSGCKSAKIVPPADGSVIILSQGTNNLVASYEYEFSFWVRLDTATTTCTVSASLPNLAIGYSAGSTSLSAAGNVWQQVRWTGQVTQDFASPFSISFFCDGPLFVDDFGVTWRQPPPSLIDQVSNGDFEDGPADSSWSYNSDGGDFSVIPSQGDVVAHGGNYLAAAYPSDPSVDLRITQQLRGLRVGRYYSVTGWYRRATPQTTCSIQVMTDQGLGATGNMFSPGFNGDDISWRQLSFPLIPSTTSPVLTLVVTECSDGLFIDDLTVFEQSG